MVNKTFSGSFSWFFWSNSSQLFTWAFCGASFPAQCPRYANDCQRTWILCSHLCSSINFMSQMCCTNFLISHYASVTIIFLIVVFGGAVPSLDKFDFDIIGIRITIVKSQNLSRWFNAIYCIHCIIILLKNIFGMVKKYFNLVRSNRNHSWNELPKENGTINPLWSTN